jgi:hypothetical protein
MQETTPKTPYKVSENEWKKLQNSLHTMSGKRPLMPGKCRGKGNTAFRILRAAQRHSVGCFAFFMLDRAIICVLPVGSVLWVQPFSADDNDSYDEGCPEGCGEGESQGGMRTAATAV